VYEGHKMPVIYVRNAVCHVNGAELQGCVEKEFNFFGIKLKLCSN
jgi:hypothetical protein